MGAVIKEIDRDSPAYKKLAPGERLVAINGHIIRDVLDYKYYAYDEILLITLQKPDGGMKLVRVRKPAGADLGLTFETYLMDKARPCANRCVFCFVDQLPDGMRKSLYFKDDDARLSFLMGNYITLTNLSKREIDRIIALKISPIHISVHATDPVLRQTLLGNGHAGPCLKIMRAFADAGIVMHCQIVCCPGLNDGAALTRSMSDLAALFPQAASVSVVPVGLTRHRTGLYPLTPFDRAGAEKAVRQVEAFAAECFKKYGSKIFFCSDELYLKAQRPLPEDAYYEGYPQLENGVGMLRLFITEAEAALAALPAFDHVIPFSVATGVSAAPFLEKIIETAAEKCDTMIGNIYAIANHFFGETIDVAGLVTGGDLISQLRGRPLGKRLLIPQSMLRHGEGVFLDDVTLTQVSDALGVPVQVVAQDGGALIQTIFGR